MIPEAEVSITVEKGVNTSTRDLVLAAISVMKGRKARPDTKRICNWVNRKYGRAVQDVVAEIDDLCTEGILEKVSELKVLSSGMDPAEIWQLKNKEAL